MQLQGIELLLGAVGDLLLRGGRLLLHIRKLHSQRNDGLALGHGKKIDQQRAGSVLQHACQILIHTENREHPVSGQPLMAHHGREGATLEIRALGIHGQLSDQGTAEDACPRRLEQVEV